MTVKKPFLPGCEADANDIIRLLDKAVKASPLKETTFCSRHLSDTNFRHRLLAGRVTPLKMRTAFLKLTQMLEVKR